MKIEYIKTIFYIVLGIIALGTSVLTIDKYFAKDREVKLVAKRLEISIHDSEVFRQEQHIQQLHNFRVFEQKKKGTELTDIEKDTFDKADKRLEKLEKEKDIKVKQYEEIKNSF
jgi:hypothetical protein